MLISWLAQQIGATWSGEDVSFGTVSTDTRTIVPGDFFVALKGPSFNGHEFIEQAFAQGAVAVMVSEEMDTHRPMIKVEDTRIGLGELARCWLQQFRVKKVVITGSSGKTTVKEMTASILSQSGIVLATKGNLNNDIGVPLTLCRLRSEHEFAVIEMGANHLGEIAYTSGLVNPDVALVNNVGTAHLEGFGSVENIARAKGEIYAGLSDQGVALINLDDAFADQYLQQTAQKKQLTWSVQSDQADVYLQSAQPDASGCYHIQVQVNEDVVSARIPFPGRHNIANALAAMSMASALNISAGDMKKGLEALKPVPGRLCPVLDITTHHIIDDSYNANPASICAAIDVLGDLSGKRCLVLGCMGELGDEARALHYQVGAHAAKTGIETVYAMGNLADSYQQGYEENAPANGRFVLAQTHQQIAESIMKHHQGETLLVKGSRSTTMENVIRKIREISERKEGSV